MATPAAGTVADVVAELARRGGPRPRVVAVDGRSGSGKSTFARALAAALGAAPVIALEDLYGGWDGLRAGVGRLRADVLAPLARGDAAEVPRYDWWRSAWEAPWRLEVPETMVVEGVGAAHPDLAAHLDLAVWLELDEPTRRRRALARDDGVFEPFWEMWRDQEDALAAGGWHPRPGDLVLDARSVLDGLVDAPATPSAGAVRHTVRVVLADAAGHVLLLQARDPAGGRLVWSAPGGGIEPGEDARSAARREVAEETGATGIDLGPELWRRHEAITWDGRALSYRERWFLAQVDRFEPSFAGMAPDERT